MKSLNSLNIAFIILTVSLTGLLGYKIVNYKASERYYYTASVSNPETFPVYITGIWFNIEKEEFASASFHKTTDVVNSFYSSWGESEYSEAHEPSLLPESLFLEYIDYRTKQYYLDTIRLPKERMTAVFNYAKDKKLLTDLNSWNKKMGLKFHVGIANDGNILFWLAGNNYEKEFYRTQLKPRTFKNTIQSTEQIIEDKNQYFNTVFESLTDSTHQQFLKENPINAQYKDSVPIYFDHLKR